MALTKRRAILALLAMPLGYYKAFAAQKPKAGPAVLTVDLDEWRGIEIHHGKESAFVSSAEIFAALEER